MSDSVSEVLAGIWRVQLSLPGHAIGHVNVYALATREGLVVVDTGWSSAYPLLQSTLDGLAVPCSRVIGVLLTHMHADHCGSSARLGDSGAWLAMHAADTRSIRHRYFDREPYQAQTRTWLSEVGAPADATSPALEQILSQAAEVQDFTPDHSFEDEEVLPVGPWRLQVLHTPGHTAGHCCFFEQTTGTLFSGDHVFPVIRANPTARPQNSENPVGDYLSSLDRLDTLPVARTLPGHQEPFAGLSERTRALRSYHLSRMEEIMVVLSDGALTSWDVAAQMNRKHSWADRPWWMRFSAVGETHAHLIHLRQSRRVEAAPVSPRLWRHRER